MFPATVLQKKNEEPLPLWSKTKCKQNKGTTMGVIFLSVPPAMCGSSFTSRVGDDPNRRIDNVHRYRSQGITCSPSPQARTLQLVTRSEISSGSKRPTNSHFYILPGPEAIEAIVDSKNHQSAETIETHTHTGWGTGWERWHVSGRKQPFTYFTFPAIILGASSRARWPTAPSPP